MLTDILVTVTPVISN